MFQRLPDNCAQLHNIYDKLNGKGFLNRSVVSGFMGTGQEGGRRVGGGRAGGRLEGGGRKGGSFLKGWTRGRRSRGRRSIP